MYGQRIASMARHERGGDGDDRSQAADRDRRTASTAELFAESTLRIVLALVGLAILLFGLSMALGVDLLAAIDGVIGTELGRWLLVALVGLAILVLAVRGFGTYYRE